MMTVWYLSQGHMALGEQTQAFMDIKSAFFNDSRLIHVHPTELFGVSVGC